MDQFYPVLEEYVNRFNSLPMFPLLQCAHFMIVTLGLRKKIGVTFAQTNPLACWVSTVVANLSGILLVNCLLARPLVTPLQDVRLILIITGIWYFAFFCPNDWFFKFFRSKPLWVTIIVLKEAHRAKGILKGVELGLSLYSNDISIIVLLGFLNGTAGLLADPLASAIRGSLSTSNNEALKPSFITKISIFISLMYTMSVKEFIDVPPPYLCLAAFLVLTFVQVSLFVSGGRDPFIAFENAVSPVCFGSPTLHTESSSSKKRKKE